MRRHSALALVVGAALMAGAAGVSNAAFSGTTGNTSAYVVAPDFTAPLASAVVIAKDPPGYLSGSVLPSSAYRVYAAVSDTGNPASGTSTVNADVSTLTAGQTNLALPAAVVNLGGVAYSHRSAVLTSAAPLGAKAYTLTSVDVATNSRLQTGYSVTVDSTAPTATDVQATNKAAGVVGKLEVGDILTLTYSETMEPYQILAAWTGASTPVTVRVANNADTITVYNSANTTQLPLGSTALGNNGYVTAAVTFTASSMAMTGGTVTITLGTTVGAPGTVATSQTLTWTPSPPVGAQDVAGNAVTVTARAETGAADPNF